MIRYFALAFVLILRSSFIFSQVVFGIVRDKETKLPLPYVHIGVFNKNMGVISREDGRFEIDLSKAEKSDELTFSMLGYEVVSKKVSDLTSTTNLDVALKPKSILLQEVTIRKDKPKPIKLGRFTPSTTTIGHSLQKEFGLGGEWGLRINNGGKKYWIDDVRFHMRFNTVDSILFRIQIYSIKDGMPDQSLLNHEMYVKSHIREHWITKNLKSENLILDQDVIVTYEVVRVWFSEKTDNEIFFTYGKGYEEGQIYSRSSSLDKWQVNQRPPAAIPVAMYLTVSEY